MASQAHKLVVGLGWVSAANYVNRILGFVTTLVLAKLLAPADFGLVAIAWTMVEVLKIFRDMGLGQALVYKRDAADLAFDTALVMILGLNLALILIACATAPLVALFFEEPQITAILIVMSTNLLPLGLRAVPDALLRRGVNFKVLAIPDMISALLASVIGIAMAFGGYGVWALVARTLVATVLNAALVWFFIEYRPRLRFDKAIARELFGYGKFVVGATLLTVALYNIEKMYIGKLADVTALGVYTFAGTIAAIPVSEFGHLLCRVVFPVLCEINDNREKLRAVFLNAARYNALIVAPLGVGIAFFGADVIDLIFGARWAAAASIIGVLAIAALLRGLSSLLHELLRATGQVRAVQRFTFTRLVLVGTLGAPALLYHGLLGVCVLVAATNLAVLGAEMRAAVDTLGCRFREVAAPAAHAIGMAIVSIGAVWALVHFAEMSASVLVLISGILIAGACYLALVIVADRRVITEARALLRGAP